VTLGKLRGISPLLRKIYETSQGRLKIRSRRLISPLLEELKTAEEEAFKILEEAGGEKTPEGGIQLKAIKEEDFESKKEYKDALSERKLVTDKLDELYGEEVPMENLKPLKIDLLEDFDISNPEIDYLIEIGLVIEDE